MRIKEIAQYLESFAPLSLQEGYDNNGLLAGNPDAEVEKALISLDITEKVIREAVDKNCRLVIAHHPLIFNGLKSLTGKNDVERSVIAAIKNDIAIYAIHTNLDNVQEGVNHKIAEVLEIKNPKILAPKKGLLKKMVVFVPLEHKDPVLNAIFSAGAGSIGNYEECSFQLEGTGSFKAGDNADPYVGEKGKRHYEKEVRLEVVVPAHLQNAVTSAMMQAHPYEEVAYDIYPLENPYKEVGSGMYGFLEEPVYALDFLKTLKDKFGGIVRYTALAKDRVQKIAWCGGSGSFLLSHAKSVGADVFITSDFKYHQFFEADNEIIIADIGHYENERYTKELIVCKLKEKFNNFAVLLAETNTNPINYL